MLKINTRVFTTAVLLIATSILSACSGGSSGGGSVTILLNAPESFTATSQLTREGWQFNVESQEFDSGDLISMEVHRDGSSVGAFSSTSSYLPATGTYTLVATNIGGSTSAVPQRLAPTAITPSLNFVSSQALSISWAHDVQASSYTLYRSASDGAAELVLSTNNIHTLDNLAAAPQQISVIDNVVLAAGTTYTYQLVAHNIGGTSTSSASYSPSVIEPSAFTVTSKLTRNGWQFNINNPQFDDGSVSINVHRDGVSVGSFSTSTFYTPATGTYTFVAINAAGSISAAAQRLAPTAITPSIDFDSTQTLSISWSHDVQASSYTLYRSIADSAAELVLSTNNIHTLENLAAAPQQISVIDNIALAADTTYTYKLVAHNIGGTSTSSASYRTVSLPSTFAATSKLTRSGWQFSINNPEFDDGSVSINVHRDGVSVGSFSTSTFYTPATGTYTLVATNELGSISATPQRLAPTAITPSINYVNPQSLNISWSHDVQASSYTLYRSIAGSSATEVMSTNNLHTLDNLAQALQQISVIDNLALAADTTYTYQLIAYNIAGSASSNKGFRIASVLPSVFTATSKLTRNGWQFNVNNPEFDQGSVSITVLRNDIAIGAFTSSSTNYLPTTGTYTLVANNLVGSSAAIVPKRAVPTAITPAIAFVNNQQLDISWSHDVQASSYTLYRSVNGGAATELTSTNNLHTLDNLAAAPQQISVIDNVTLAADTTYTYKLVAHNVSGSTTSSASYRTPSLPNVFAATSKLTPNGWQFSVTSEELDNGDITMAVHRDGASVGAFSTSTFYLPATGTYTLVATNVIGSTSVAPQRLAPTAITPAIAFVNNQQLDISWSHDVQASSYTLYRSVNDGAATEVMSTNNLHTLDNLTAAPAQIDVEDGFALAADTTYTYKLVAHNVGGSTTSSASYRTPSAPNVFTATSKLTRNGWQFSVTSAELDNGEITIAVHRDGASLGAFSTSTLYLPATGTYTLVAINTISSTSVTPQRTAPTATAASISYIGSQTFSISWAHDVQASSYTLYRSIADGAATEVMSTNNIHTLENLAAAPQQISVEDVITLAAETTYTYSLVAHNIGGNSTSSVSYLTSSLPKVFAATSKITRNGWQFSVTSEELDNGAITMAVHRDGASVGTFSTSTFYLPATGTYTLVASNDGGSTSVTPQRLAPTAINPFVGYISSQALSISWAHDVQASSYTLYRSIVGGTAIEVLSTNNIHTLDNLAQAPQQISVIDSIDFAVGTTYTYELIAYNVSGSASSSTDYMASGDAPSTFTATSKLTRNGWQFNVYSQEYDAGLVRMDVYRDSSSVASFSSGTAYSPVTGTYTLVASNDGGSTSSTPQRLAPTAITPDVMATSSQQLSVSWAHDVQASSYTLYRSIAGSAETLVLSTNNIHTLENLSAAPLQLSLEESIAIVADTTYTYKLVAHNVSGSATSSQSYRSPSQPSVFTATSKLTRNGWQFNINNPEFDDGSVSMNVHRNGSIIGAFTSSTSYLPATGTYTLVASNFSGSTAIVPQRIAPTAITPDVMATASHQLIISWAHDVQASSYTLYRSADGVATELVLSTSNIHTLENLAVAPAQVTVADSFTLAVDTTYTYELVAHNVAGSVSSAQDYRSPAKIIASEFSLHIVGTSATLSHPQSAVGRLDLVVSVDHQFGSTVYSLYGPGNIPNSTAPTTFSIAGSNRHYNLFVSDLYGSTIIDPSVSVVANSTLISPTEVRITWQHHHANVDDYRVYDSNANLLSTIVPTNAGLNPEDIVTATIAFNLANALVADTTYTYHVVTYTVDGQSSTETLMIKTPAGEALDASFSQRLTAAGEVISYNVVNWEAMQNLGIYLNGVLVQLEPLTQSTGTITLAADAGSYTFAAFGGFSSSLPVAAVVDLPPVSTPTLVITSSQQISISWAHDIQASSYTLYRSDNGATATVAISVQNIHALDNLAAAPTQVTEADNFSLVPETVYSYQLVAHNAGGNTTANAVVITAPAGVDFSAFSFTLVGEKATIKHASSAINQTALVGTLQHYNSVSHTVYNIGHIRNYNIALNQPTEFQGNLTAGSAANVVDGDENTHISLADGSANALWKLDWQHPSFVREIHLRTAASNQTPIFNAYDSSGTSVYEHAFTTQLAAHTWYKLDVPAGTQAQSLQVTKSPLYLNEVKVHAAAIPTNMQPFEFTLTGVKAEVEPYVLHLNDFYQKVQLNAYIPLIASVVPLSANSVRVNWQHNQASVLSYAIFQDDTLLDIRSYDDLNNSYDLYTTQSLSMDVTAASTLSANTSYTLSLVAVNTHGKHSTTTISFITPNADAPVGTFSERLTRAGTAISYDISNWQEIGKFSIYNNGVFDQTILLTQSTGTIILPATGIYTFGGVDGFATSTPTSAIAQAATPAALNASFTSSQQISINWEHDVHNSSYTLYRESANSSQIFVFNNLNDLNDLNLATARLQIVDNLVILPDTTISYTLVAHTAGNNSADNATSTFNLRSPVLLDLAGFSMHIVGTTATLSHPESAVNNADFTAKIVLNGSVANNIYGTHNVPESTATYSFVLASSEHVYSLSVSDLYGSASIAPSIEVVPSGAVVNAFKVQIDWQHHYANVSSYKIYDGNDDLVYNNDTPVSPAAMISADITLPATAPLAADTSYTYYVATITADGARSTASVQVKTPPAVTLEATFSQRLTLGGQVITYTVDDWETVQQIAIYRDDAFYQTLNLSQSTGTITLPATGTYTFNSLFGINNLSASTELPPVGTPTLVMSSSQQISITWAHDVQASSYTLYKSVGGSTEVVTSVNNIHFLDSLEVAPESVAATDYLAIEPETTYSYHLVAHNAGGSTTGSIATITSPIRLDFSEFSFSIDADQAIVSHSDSALAHSHLVGSLWQGNTVTHEVYNGRVRNIALNQSAVVSGDNPGGGNAQSPMDGDHDTSLNLNSQGGIVASWQVDWQNVFAIQQIRVKANFGNVTVNVSAHQRSGASAYNNSYFTSREGWYNFNPSAGTNAQSLKLQSNQNISVYEVEVDAALLPADMQPFLFTLENTATPYSLHLADFYQNVVLSADIELSASLRVLANFPNASARLNWQHETDLVTSYQIHHDGALLATITDFSNAPTMSTVVDFGKQFTSDAGYALSLVAIGTNLRSTTTLNFTTPSSDGPQGTITQRITAAGVLINYDISNWQTLSSLNVYKGEGTGTLIESIELTQGIGTLLLPVLSDTEFYGFRGIQGFDASKDSARAAEVAASATTLNVSFTSSQQLTISWAHDVHHDSYTLYRVSEGSSKTIAQNNPHDLNDLAAAPTMIEVQDDLNIIPATTISYTLVAHTRSKDSAKNATSSLTYITPAQVDITGFSLHILGTNATLSHPESAVLNFDFIARLEQNNAEVLAIYGHESATNVALSKVALQTSVVGSNAAANAVDGNLNTLAQTQSNAASYWELDLANSYRIARLKVYAGESDQYRLHWFNKNIGTTITANVTQYDNSHPVTNGWLDLSSFDRLDARYLRIHDDNDVQLKEVQVFSLHTPETTEATSFDLAGSAQPYTLSVSDLYGNISLTPSINVEPSARVLNSVSVEVSWQHNYANVASYAVYDEGDVQRYSQTPNSAGIAAPGAWVASLSFPTDEALAPSTTYTYRVITLTDGGKRSTASVQVKTPEAVILEGTFSQHLTVDGQVIAYDISNWENVGTLVIYRDNVIHQQIVLTGQTGSITLPATGTYTFGGIDGFSSSVQLQASVALPPVSMPTLVLDSSQQISISWAHDVQASSYTLYKSVGESTSTVKLSTNNIHTLDDLASAPAQITMVDSFTLVPDSTYTYLLVAHNAGGNTTASAVSIATPSRLDLNAFAVNFAGNQATVSHPASAINYPLLVGTLQQGSNVVHTVYSIDELRNIALGQPAEFVGNSFRGEGAEVVVDGNSNTGLFLTGKGSVSNPTWQVHWQELGLIRQIRTLTNNDQITLAMSLNDSSGTTVQSFSQTVTGGNWNTITVPAGTLAQSLLMRSPGPVIINEIQVNAAAIPLYPEPSIFTLDNTANPYYLHLSDFYHRITLSPYVELAASVQVLEAEKVRLTWQHDLDFIQSYEVFDENNVLLISTSSLNVGSKEYSHDFSFAGLQAATSYTLSLVAIDADGRRSTNNLTYTTPERVGPVGTFSERLTRTGVIISYDISNWQALVDLNVYRDGTLYRAVSLTQNSGTVQLPATGTYTFGGISAFDPDAPVNSTVAPATSVDADISITSSQQISISWAHDVHHQSYTLYRLTDSTSESYEVTPVRDLNNLAAASTTLQLQDSFSLVPDSNVRYTLVAHTEGGINANNATSTTSVQTPPQVDLGGFSLHIVGTNASLSHPISAHNNARLNANIWHNGSVVHTVYEQGNTVSTSATTATFTLAGSAQPYTAVISDLYGTITINPSVSVVPSATVINAFRVDITWQHDHANVSSYFVSDNRGTDIYSSTTLGAPVATISEELNLGSAPLAQETTYTFYVVTLTEDGVRSTGSITVRTPKVTDPTASYSQRLSKAGLVLTYSVDNWQEVQQLSIYRDGDFYQAVDLSASAGSVTLAITTGTLTVGGIGGFSNADAQAVVITPPAVSTPTLVVDTSQQISISWAHDVHNSSYTLYKSSAGSTATLATRNNLHALDNLAAAPAQVTMTDGFELVPDTTYTYQLVGHNAGGTTTVTAVIAAPSRLDFSAFSVNIVGNTATVNHPANAQNYFYLAGTLQQGSEIRHTVYSNQLTNIALHQPAEIDSEHSQSHYGTAGNLVDGGHAQSSRLTRYPASGTGSNRITWQVNWQRELLVAQVRVLDETNERGLLSLSLLDNLDTSLHDFNQKMTGDSHNFITIDMPEDFAAQSLRVTVEYFLNLREVQVYGRLLPLSSQPFDFTLANEAAAYHLQLSDLYHSSTIGTTVSVAPVLEFLSRNSVSLTWEHYMGIVDRYEVYDQNGALTSYTSGPPPYTNNTLVATLDLSASPLTENTTHTFSVVTVLQSGARATATASIFMPHSPTEISKVSDNGSEVGLLLKQLAGKATFAVQRHTAGGMEEVSTEIIIFDASDVDGAAAPQRTRTVNIDGSSIYTFTLSNLAGNVALTRNADGTYDSMIVVTNSVDDGAGIVTENTAAEQSVSASVTNAQPAVSVGSASELVTALQQAGASNIVLAADVDFSAYVFEQKGDAVIAQFAGSLDGAGFSLNNLTLSSTNNLAFIEVLTGSIDNLRLNNITLHSSASAAALVLENRGSISRVSAENLTISGAMIGGLVAQQSTSGSIVNSYVRSSTLTGNTLGALIGNFAGSAHNNYAAQLSLVCDTGSAIGYSLEQNLVSNSYFVSDSSTTCDLQDDGSLLIERSVLEQFREDNTGWDSNIWQFTPDTAYPTLK